VNNSIISRNELYTASHEDWGGITNGFYFGNLENMIKILKRYQYLNEYLPTINNYENVLYESFKKNKIKRIATNIYFSKIRANKTYIFQGVIRNLTYNDIKSI
jgi:MinD-like ATPase involved in chromosome partitioning or flagellar assembly